MPPPKKSLELSLDAILARCIFDNELSSDEVSLCDSSRHSLVRVSLSLNDLVTATQTSDNQHHRQPDNSDIEVISPLSSIIDLIDNNSSTKSYPTSYWDSIYSGTWDSQCCYDPSVRSELPVTWDDTALECRYPVKTELRILWYGYPISRPKTPDVICRPESMKFNCDQEPNKDIQVLSAGCFLAWSWIAVDRLPGMFPLGGCCGARCG